MTDKQLTLATQTDAGFERHRKTTRRDVFLAEMDKVVPWAALCALIAPVYPKASENGGRPAIGLERMLRMYFLQHWYNLSDPAVEESLYDSQAMRRFVGIDLGREPVPDETTLCKFRHLLERNNLGKNIFAATWKHLEANGFSVSRGTIVDATIIAAPPSTTLHQSRAAHRECGRVQQSLGARIRVVASPVADRQIDLIVDEVRQAVVRFDADANLRMIGLEAMESRCQPFRRERGQRADPDDLVTDVDHLLQRILEQGKDGVELLGQRTPGLGKNDGAVVTQEQLHFEMVLEALDLVADRRRRNEQLLGRCRETLPARRRLERLERDEWGIRPYFHDSGRIRTPAAGRVSFAHASPKRNRLLPLPCVVIISATTFKGDRRCVLNSSTATPWCLWATRTNPWQRPSSMAMTQCWSMRWPATPMPCE